MKRLRSSEQENKKKRRNKGNKRVKRKKKLGKEQEALRRGRRTHTAWGGAKEGWMGWVGLKGVGVTNLEETGGELLQLLAELVSHFRQPLTLLIFQQQLLTHTRANTRMHTYTQKTNANKHKCKLTKEQKKYVYEKK